MEPGKYLYARHHDICFLKFTGHITYTTSPDLDRFLVGLFGKPDFLNILVDLSETSGIDSTNLGLLARIARFTLDQLGKKTVVVSTRPDINRVLDTMERNAPR
jgi:anti-anti-sigma factor